jgi:uncharacterized protein YqeY
MSIKQQISDDVKHAMRAKDTNKLMAMRLITAAIKQIEIDERIEVDDARVLMILDKLVKQRNDSISQFKTAGRLDLVEQEQFELDIIKHYLPTPLSASEITQHISDVLKGINEPKMSDMGKIMTQLKPLLQGRADMAQVSATIKSMLAVQR